MMFLQLKTSLVKIRPCKGVVRRSLLFLAGAAALGFTASAPFAYAQRQQPRQNPEEAWQAGAIGHAQAMRAFRDRDGGAQPTPSVIPKLGVAFDPSGLVATENASGATPTARNAFFQDLGSNGRTCLTCHQPQNGWSISAASVQARFYASEGADPLFRLVDGATCPSDDISTPTAKGNAYSLLLQKGLIRIGLPLPAGAEYVIAAVDDPYHCNTNPTTGLTSATSGIISVYRRPLPATNLGFLSAIMWDAREPSLGSQAIDATLGHAQANAPPTPAQVQQIVAFESGLVTAQRFDNHAKELDADEATGGPVPLVAQLAKFFIGVNDPFGLNPINATFDPKVFDLYDAWLNVSGHGPVNEARRQIARGEAIFNTTPINITGVAGINDALHKTSVSGFCSTCHDTPNVGDHSIAAALDIGVADAGANAPSGLDVSGLPVFTLQCVSGPLSGQVFTVTDPGRSLISGKCADIGKLKGPILRGLAARAPYFHNGSAATLMDVVNFYDQRFAIGFTEEQKKDLVAFLNTL